MTKTQIEIIRNNLLAKVDDFSVKVAPIYKMLDWKWWRGVPNEGEIKEALLDLINSLSFSEKEQLIRSGGLAEANHHLLAAHLLAPNFSK